jgi:hypothetical protein
VQVDRVKVGDGQGGSQPVHVGPGASGANSSWAVDGVVVTDMAALGSSAAYCDFDALEEVEITTGGTDAAMAISGVSVNWSPGGAPTNGAAAPESPRGHEGRGA